MSETFTRWDPARHLNSREDICAYLDACTAEDPGDGSLILDELGDIASAWQ